MNMVCNLVSSTRLRVDSLLFIMQINSEVGLADVWKMVDGDGTNTICRYTYCLVQLMVGDKCTRAVMFSKTRPQFSNRTPFCSQVVKEMEKRSILSHNLLIVLVPLFYLFGRKSIREVGFPTFSMWC